MNHFPDSEWMVLTVWLIKTTFVCLARWPRNQFSRAIAMKITGCAQPLCISAEQLWLPLSEHRISFTRWPRTQNLLISLKIQPALYTSLSAPLPSAAFCCYGSPGPTKEGVLQKEKSTAKMLRDFMCHQINIHDATMCLRPALWVVSRAIAHPQITPKWNCFLLKKINISPGGLC